MKYRASISMRDNRNRLKSLLKDSDNEGYIFLNAELPVRRFDMCEHDWFYLGGHNEWWVCRKCGVRERR